MEVLFQQTLHMAIYIISYVCGDCLIVELWKVVFLATFIVSLLIYVVSLDHKVTKQV